MTLLPAFFLDSVAAIGYDGPDGVKFGATGFLYGQFSHKNEKGEGQYKVALVSNRHVFEGKKRVHVRHNPDGAGEAKVFPLDLINASGKPIWVAHPNAAVDVAVVPVNYKWLLDQKMKVMFIEQDRHARTVSAYVAEGGSEGDGVFVLGFPLGNTGGDRNYVIVRGGVIARMSHILAGSNDNFLIDANIFPGNSGGPVISRPESTSIQGTKAVGAPISLEWWRRTSRTRTLPSASKQASYESFFRRIQVSARSCPSIA